MQCPACAGKGKVVQPVIVVDPETGEIRTRQEAGTCRACAGTGEA